MDSFAIIYREGNRLCTEWMDAEDKAIVERYATKIYGDKLVKVAPAPTNVVLVPPQPIVATVVRPKVCKPKAKKDKLLTIEQAARLMNVSEQQVVNLLCNRRLRGVGIGLPGERQIWQSEA